MNIVDIQKAITYTKPFEHRMSPYMLNGATIIDDTYNGNIKGINAGLELLKKIEASGKKIYVTPGLVEQGDQSEKIHVEIGRLITAAKPDEVVLMNNSTTEHIKRGLEESKYAGHVRIVFDPLKFYTNLKHFVVAGDVVLMQNDWTDNYK